MISINSTSKKTAAIFSYVYLALNSVMSILIAPILLKYLGVDEYGLYQMVYSMGHYILILDLGIGTVMVRYIAEYRAKEDCVGMREFAGMIAILTLIICLIVICVGLVVNSNLENIFTNLKSEDYVKSHTMFNLMIYQFVVTIIDNYIQGCISAYERFVFTKIFGIFKVCVVFTLTILFVYLGFGAVGILMANALVITGLAIINIIYAFKSLHFRIRLTRWKAVVMMPVWGLMIAMLLQSIVANVNSTVDKTILGIMCTPADVAVYSIAASIITLFNMVPTVISGFFQPQVTRMVVKGTNGAELTDLVVRVGRWQFVLCSAFLAGLVLLGQDFMNLWVGGHLSSEEMRFSLLIILLILPFNMVPLVQTICVSILNAYDKRMSRSLILMAICVLNIIFTVVAIGLWGPIGSPLGTALSYFIGYVVILNIYYSRSLHLEVSRMFKEIFSRLWICVVVSTLLCLPLCLWHMHSWMSFIVKGILFSLVLFILLYFKGFNAEEKGIVNSYLYKFSIIKNRD